MRLHLDELWDEDDASVIDEPVLERLLPPLGGGFAHAEDALLSDFVSYAQAREAGAPAYALEQARAALDAVDVVDGPWQSLPVERWLAELSRPPGALAAAQLDTLARSFIEFLVDRGLLGLHGQRLLARRIAHARRRDQAAQSARQRLAGLAPRAQRPRSPALAA